MESLNTITLPFLLKNSCSIRASPFCVFFFPFFLWTNIQELVWTQSFLGCVCFCVRIHVNSRPLKFSLVCQDRVGFESCTKICCILFTLENFCIHLLYCKTFFFLYFNHKKYNKKKSSVTQFSETCWENASSVFVEILLIFHNKCLGFTLICLYILWFSSFYLTKFTFHLKIHN